MKRILYSSAAVVLLGLTTALAEPVRFADRVFDPVGVAVSIDELMGKTVMKVVKDSAVQEFDAPTFARVQRSNFKNGIIEVRVLSRLTKDAPPFARGFD